MVDNIQHFIWPAAAVISLILFSFVFREQVADLLSRISGIEFDSERNTFRVNFNKQIEVAQAQARGIEAEISRRRIIPVPDVNDVEQQTARDVVLEAWGSLKQSVSDSCVAKMIPLPPVARISEAIRRLAEAKIINAEVTQLLYILDQLGQELADNPRLRPTAEDAVMYVKLSTEIVEWMMRHLLSPDNKKKAKRRATVIDSHIVPQRGAEGFPPPKRGQPTALLVGLGGSVVGQKFPLDRERYKIGRDSDNDLRIVADEDVSGHHAFLLYNKGQIFLSDRGSRNGTFLNERKIKGTARVQWGDQIRLGEAVLRISAIQV